MHKINDYLHIKDAASLVGVCAGTLRNWEKKGKLKAHRNPHNKYRLYKKQELEALLKEIEGSLKMRMTFLQGEIQFLEEGIQSCKNSIPKFGKYLQSSNNSLRELKEMAARGIPKLEKNIHSCARSSQQWEARILHCTTQIPYYKEKLAAAIRQMKDLSNEK